jgi:hypothetical protein
MQMNASTDCAGWAAAYSGLHRGAHQSQAQGLQLNSKSFLDRKFI